MFNLRRLLAPLLCGVLLAAWSSAGQTAPVTARFSGTVADYYWGFLDPNASALDDDYPVGTLVDWDLTFDDGFLALGYPGAFSPVAASGTLHVGTDDYTLTGMRFASLSFDANSNISSYGAQISGSGPGTSDGADFFSMFWGFAPDLSLTGAPYVGYGYTNGFATTYGYLIASGDYSVGPANLVPEPATALLAMPALFMLLRKRRRRKD